MGPNLHEHRNPRPNAYRRQRSNRHHNHQLCRRCFPQLRRRLQRKRPLRICHRTLLDIHNHNHHIQLHSNPDHSHLHLLVLHPQGSNDGKLHRQDKLRTLRSLGQRVGIHQRHHRETGPNSSRSSRKRRHNEPHIARRLHTQLGNRLQWRPSLRSSNRTLRTQFQRSSGTPFHLHDHNYSW